MAQTCLLYTSNKNNQTKELMSNYQNQLENLEDKIQKVVHYISEG